MEKREFESKRRYIWAFIIATLIFLIIISLSYGASYFELSRVSNLQQDTAYGIFEDGLMGLFFDENICLNKSFEAISQNLNFQGRIIDDLEKKLGKNNPTVLNRKRFYNLVELEHFQFVRTFNQKCNFKIPTILFFYSNQPSDNGKSNDIGNMLNILYQENPEMIVYSFDVNLDSVLISKLKEKYNITSSPTLIINENTKLENIKNINEIRNPLEK